jgi:glycosyltransferase involved in cell wall biosynthesis
MSEMKTLSVVIPVYNEEKTIIETFDAVKKADSLGFFKEIIIIDDGSTDKTAQVIKGLEKKHTSKKEASLKIILSPRNEGKGAAMKKGLMASTGEIVIVQDADLEYDPGEFPIMLEPFIKNKSDVVYGSRFISNRPHRVLYFWHYQVNLFLTLLSNVLTNLNLTDMETGYKAFTGDLIRTIAPHLESKRFGFEPEITARIAKIRGIKIYEVGVSYTGRTYAEGKKIGWRDGIKALWEIFKYNLLVDSPRTIRKN